jgi:hypothetical protein
VSEQSKTTTRWRCSKCGKLFRAERDGRFHIDAKHKGSGDVIPDALRRDDDEPSMAEIAIEASLKRSMGEPLDPLKKVYCHDRQISNGNLPAV